MKYDEIHMKKTILKEKKKRNIKCVINEKYKLTINLSAQKC